jgi:hypothetical protein
VNRRSEQQISNIITRGSDPLALEQVVSLDIRSDLIELFYSSPDQLTHKNTGPITLDLTSEMIEQSTALHSVLNLIHDHIGPFDITAALFFSVQYPHIIHNDDTFELPPNVYKAITIPLELYGGGDDTIQKRYPQLCIFNQSYFHGPVKCFHGETDDQKSFYNRPIYDYSDVYGVGEFDSITEIQYQQYFTHLKRKWLTGLSIAAILPWVPGNMLIFDSTRLHCASDFRRLRYSGKLGLSIFTKIR